MLISLSIQNYAIIEKLSIDFSDGFIVLTGETGAGKSILLDALELVLGKRADLAVLKNKEEKCVIETVFDLKKYGLQPFFSDNDLDYENETILRREILPSGKSRSFVNDSPVNLSELSVLREKLIDIHSQHQTLELANQAFQFQLIDAYADNLKIRQNYSEQLKQYKQISAKLIELKNEYKNVILEQDYNSFLLTELEEAALVSGEQEELENLQNELSHAEQIIETFGQCINLAENDELGLVKNLTDFKNQIQKISEYSDTYRDVSQRAESVLIEFKDVVSELNRLSEKISANPEELNRIEQKLHKIYSLQKKHLVQSVDELIQICEGLSKKIHSTELLEQSVSETEQQLEAKKKILVEQADILHERRIGITEKLIFSLTEILKNLGMPHAKFRIEVIKTESFNEYGTDEISFLFSSNPGSDFASLKKIASGGEMSRIMLAAKSVLANYTALPSIIFDEIDTGVSGEIADKMAEIMKNLSKNMQVFAITHLPQIAAKGTAHYKVYKSVQENMTTTEIKQLNRDERIHEIAQMVSGAEISDSAIRHAKALLG